MGRLQKTLAEAEAVSVKAVEAEVERLDGRPDNIDAETWELIQDTGREACARLYEIITGPRFHRIRAGDQAKLIALAQNRAFGMPMVTKSPEIGRRKGSMLDVTASELRDQAARALLPEYNQSRGLRVLEKDDSEIL